MLCYIIYYMLSLSLYIYIYNITYQSCPEVLAAAVLHQHRPPGRIISNDNLFRVVNTNSNT